jgi:hypothetical protein
MRLKSSVAEPLIEDIYLKLLSDGKGSAARNCLKEARLQSCESTDRNHIKGRALRGESAQDDKALWFRRHGKCGGCAAKVHVIIRGDLLYMR